MMYRTIPDHKAGDIATKRAERDNERPYRKPTWRTRETPEHVGDAGQDVGGEAIPMPEVSNG